MRRLLHRAPAANLVLLLASLIAGCAPATVAQAPVPPRAPAGGVATAVLVDERFDAPRPIPALATYEALTSELGARLEQGGRWHLILDRGSEATAEIAGGAAVLRITRAGDPWYAVQLAYLPVRLRPGAVYRVTFRASADRKIVTTFDLARVGGGWHSYSGRRELAIGRADQAYEVRFETGTRESEERSRFEFNFGGEGPAVVRIDDVRVIEETPLAP